MKMLFKLNNIDNRRNWPFRTFDNQTLQSEPVLIIEEFELGQNKINGLFLLTSQI